MEKKPVLVITENEISSVNRFDTFLKSLAQRFPERWWPPEQDYRKLCEGIDSMFFYFAENEEGEVVGTLVAHSFIHSSDKAGAYGWYLFADPDYKETPVGISLINLLKENFDFISLKAEPMGLRRDLTEREENEIGKRLIRYYKALGFEGNVENRPSQLKWQRV